MSATTSGRDDGGGVDRDLVGPGEQQRARILDRAHPAADGQRHEAHFRRAPDDVEQRPAPFVAGGDVEEAQLVRPGRVIGARLLDRVAGILEIDEVDALDHAAIGDVETGDDADADGHALMPVRHRDRRRKVEPPVIERAAGDHAFDALAAHAARACGCRRGP